ncbi:MAG: adenosylcobinamide-GDP ribazoletransferase [Dehalococcoidales bacterium]|nr:adenosylcobinamide-GDP ribazoletransferase [Dehalococcoidales bacterium]
MKFLSALRFLTIIPVPLWREASPKEVGGSLSYFPVVGFIIGLILAILNWLLSPILPPAVVNGLLIAAMVLLSGALHLDGFIDTCDGLAGHRTVEDRWRIMHDSRSGAFGIVGAVVLLLVKYASLSSVPSNLMTATLVIMPVVSRWAMVYAVFAYPYARPTGLGRVFKEGASGPGLALATFFTLVVATGAAWWAKTNYFYLVGLVIVSGAWLITWLMATYLKRKLAGLTGDTYGAINEVAEVGVLLIVCLLAYNQWLL